MTQSVLLYKKHKPLISIITVVLNNRVGLELTAASVVNQICFSNMEWIVIDGGSTDGGVDVLKSYQDELTYWVSEPDGGIYEAMNKGLMHANGEYVLFLNAGDALCSADVMTHVLEDTRYGKVDYLSGNIYYTIDNEVIGKSYSPKVVTGLYLFKESLGHQSTFMRTSRLKEYGGYDTKYRIVADAKFFFEDMIMRDASYSKLDFYVSNYDLSGVSTINWTANKKERERFLKEILPERIYADYQRMAYGETTLEKLECKMGKKSFLYKLLTYLAIFGYIPKAILNRVKMKKR